VNNLQPISQEKNKSKNVESLLRALRSFSFAEKIIFSVLVVLFVGSSLYLLPIVNRHFSVQVPVQGGTLTEGIVGYVGYINPILAVTDSGRDLTELMYSGLLKTTPEGTLVPELAEDYTISTDGLTYTFVLRSSIFFHDGSPITADDVVFTIQKVQDQALKSPVRPNWDGVTVKKVDDRTVSFTLSKPYAPFLENTTLGIIPKHIWKNARNEDFTYSKYNFEPIGSGPYKLYDVERNASGVPQNYNLVPFDQYPMGSAHIAHLIIKTFSNEKNMIEAYQQGDIQSMYDVSPQVAKSIARGDSQVHTAPLARVFGIFFNQNQAPVLANKEVRQALQLATDRQAIIDNVLGGYGIAITDPIPPGALPADTNLSVAVATTSVEGAIKILTDAGWKPNTEGIMTKKVGKETAVLQFSISTSDTPELVQAANMVKVMWQKIGANVGVKIFETGELNQSVIRPRKYDALLFGEIIGRDLDLYAFWHSSGRLDPGLNIAEYVNVKADKILEKARTITNMQDRLDQYAAFETEVRNDIPAIFLYAPDFIYILPKSIKGASIGPITIPSERFSGVSEWYINTENVWKIFVKNTSN
jgi:peptide/nickel transport system substrate-binding protein